MKILGHPLHMILIHFPSAFFPMDFVCSALAFYFGDSHLAYTSFYCMMGGVLMGCLAVITGVFDLAALTQNQPAALKKALIHGGINVSVLIVYSMLAFIAYKNYPAVLPAGIGILVVKGSLVAFLIVGNYLGGSLILKDKVGIHK